MTPIHYPSVLEAPVLDAVAQRWSTRIFDAVAPVDESALASALEAARWAPSAANTQPWRFVVARRGSDAHRTIAASLTGFNPQWASAAAALVVVLARTVRDDGSPLAFAEYDAGQASAYFSLQAHTAGLHTHQMGGFDHAALAQTFHLDETVVPLTVIAVGAFGDPAGASDEVRTRESAPRTRRPLAESVLVDA